MRTRLSRKHERTVYGKGNVVYMSLEEDLALTKLALDRNVSKRSLLTHIMHEYLANAGAISSTGSQPKQLSPKVARMRLNSMLGQLETTYGKKERAAERVEVLDVPITPVISDEPKPTTSLPDIDPLDVL